MKKVFFVLLLFGLGSCQQDKIGFVDNVKLMEKYQGKIDFETSYQSKSADFNKRRDSITQAFQMEVQAFQSKAEGMNQKKAQEEQGMLQQRGQFMGQQLQQQEQKLQAEGQTAMDSLVSRIKKEIKEYGESNGYTFILGGGEGGSVLYGKETQDITEELVIILNNRYTK